MVPLSKTRDKSVIWQSETMISRTRDMILCVNCLLHKYERLSSHPQFLSPQNPTWKHRPVIPVLQTYGQVDPGGWLASQSDIKHYIQ